MQVLKVFLIVSLVLVSAERSECVQCFAQFNLNRGECDDLIGEVDEDDCCQNPLYGYKAEDGVCRSCGPPTWSPWSPWPECNVLCGDGVMQRSRKCVGKGPCPTARGSLDFSDYLETIPCSSTCCNIEKWGLWQPWSPCSVSCGQGGVWKRKRDCLSPPECRSACIGPSEETEQCPPQSTCPVHGGWTAWANWADCSGSCISNKGVPRRVRKRTCSNPAPSSDTVPPGNSCRGDSSQEEECSELPNCPVNGNWGAWLPAGPCSVTCGVGLQLSNRRCDNPAPRYGGRPCDGQSTQSSICQSPCPVDGVYTGWSNWGECSSSCIPQGSVPIRTRHRTCSNPGPSSNPPGGSCQGEDRQTDRCNQLPHCQVHGNWGPWSPFSPCPVTCGVGLQVSVRRCENPAPQYGGQPCPGEERRTSTCKTDVHCPVDGSWSDWSEWSQCLYPFANKKINCRQIGGSQTRERECLHRAHNGSICSGTKLTDRRVCYDVEGCPLTGTWDGWEPWRLCRHPCGQSSHRFRVRHCKPDYSGYSPTIGRQGEAATFFGRPLADCGDPPDGGKFEKQQCINVPACPPA